MSAAPAGTPAKVLQVCALEPHLAGVLDDRYASLRLPPGPDRAGFVRERCGGVELVVTNGGTGIDAALMTGLPALRAVVCFGAGYDRVDVAAARSRGIAVANTPDVLTACVADLAVGLLLDVFRGISAGDRFVRRGAWRAGAGFPLQTRFSGRRVGILGMGRIGVAVAERLGGFGTVISYHNRRPRADVPYTYVGSAVELARGCDALVVTAAAGPESDGLVSRAVLQELAGGYLVNVARGSLVDEQALVELVVDGTLAGAALDVFRDEPHVPAALVEADNVVLLPHVGSGTTQTRRAMSELALANVEQYFADGTLRTPVP